MPVQAFRLQDGDDFEEAVFKELSRDLNKLSDSFAVASPFYLEGKRQYDGLIISPCAVFTLEMKNAKGSVHMGPNTPLTIRDGFGNEIEAFNNRHEDARTQADLQWRKLSDYFKANYNTDSIFVKAVLVFPNGTQFFVPPEHRDFSDYRVTVMFATVGELPQLVQQMHPPYPLSLDRQVQEIIIRGIRDGVYSLADREKKLVTHVMPPKQPTSSNQPSATVKSSTPLRSSYDVVREKINARPATTSRRYSYEITPITTEPPREQERPYRERPYWLFLLLGFGAVYFLISFISTTTAALAGAAIFTFFMWRKRKMLAAMSVVLLFLGIIFVNSVNPFAIIQPFIGSWEPSPQFTDSSGREEQRPTVEPLLENESDVNVESVESKEGESDSGATAVPATPRLRVIGNSNVRSEPSVEGSVVGTAESDTVFIILDQTADFNWYKIRLPNGTEGWIGSTRIERLTP